MDALKLTPAEIQSGLTRQKWAEGLIEQLPATHEGRNSWLLNYGVGEEAMRRRTAHGLTFNPEYMAIQATDRKGTRDASFTML